LIRIARLEWRRAVYLASIIGNPTYRNEYLFRIAENVASGSRTISNDMAKSLEIESLGNRSTTAPRALTQQEREALTKLADTVLVDSWEVANKIDRLIWKNRAKVRIALEASDSGQHQRGVELARGIENAESRGEALLILAESQSRPPYNQTELATATYQAAAEAIASIPQDGLRGVLVGFLVDSLIATGRFDDARACVVIYPEESEKFVALGAIAESQGKRGAAAAARKWIASDVPPAYRPALYRRVAAGALWAVEQERSKEFPTGDASIPAVR
jgi:hypothetical protein